jgi:hypothetical protein
MAHAFPATCPWVIRNRRRAIIGRQQNLETSAHNLPASSKFCSQAIVLQPGKHEGDVTSAAFSPDGRWVVLCQEDA